MEPEVIFNLWVFIQSIGPMHVIYELGVRPYVTTGSDDEMTRLLKELAVSDFHFARRFPLPDRYYLDVKEEDGWLRASSGDDTPATGRKVRKGLALVRPDISGMNQMEYFKEALDAVEQSLPARQLGVGGGTARAPTVNRKNLLSVITSVNIDSNGNQVALVESPHKTASPTASICLWMFNDERAKAIYAVSGRGYMLHGSDSNKMRTLKVLAPNDFSMVGAQPLACSPSDTYSKELFKDVFQSIEQEIPATIGIDGKMKNNIAIKVRDSLSIATQVTEHPSKAAATILVKVIDDTRPTSAGGRSASFSSRKKSFFQRLFGN